MFGDGEVTIHRDIISFVARLKRIRRMCQCHKTTTFYSTSSVINNLRKADAIKIGAYTHVRGELLIFGHGGRISIGEYCYVGENTRIWSGKSIDIGDRVLISHNCNIFDNDTHPISPRERHEQFKAIISTGQPGNISLNDKTIVIEDDVLIGANVSVLKGVRVGRGAVIGIGSLVLRDVPSYTIVAGNPAKIVREISIEERQ